MSVMVQMHSLKNYFEHPAFLVKNESKIEIL